MLDIWVCKGTIYICDLEGGAWLTHAMWRRRTVRAVRGDGPGRSRWRAEKGGCQGQESDDRIDDWSSGDRASKVHGGPRGRQDDKKKGELLEGRMKVD